MFATSPADFPSSSLEEHSMHMWPQCTQRSKYGVEQTTEFHELPNKKVYDYVRQVTTISRIVLLVEALAPILILANGSLGYEMSLSLTVSTRSNSYLKAKSINFVLK